MKEEVGDIREEEWDGVAGLSRRCDKKVLSDLVG